MVGYGEGSEPGVVKQWETRGLNAGMAAIAEATVGSTTLLQQEIHALANGILTGEETEGAQQIANRENVYDEKGNIIDVRFQQDGKVRTLKNLLSGTYTIEMTHDSNCPIGGDSSWKDNKLWINDPGDLPDARDFNVVLLHEAGHLVDEQRNRSVYQPLEKELLKAKVNRLLLFAKRLDITDKSTLSPSESFDVELQIERYLSFTTLQDFLHGVKLLPGTIAVCRQMIEDATSRLTSQEIDEIQTAFENTNRYIEEDHPGEDLAQMEKTQR